MSAKAFYRFNGSLLLVGSILCIIAHLFHPLEAKDSAQFLATAATSSSAHVLLYFACLLVMVSLPTLLVRQHTRIGVVGAFSLLGIILGLGVGELAHSVLEFSAVPALALAQPDNAFTIMQTINAYENPSLIIVAIAVNLMMVVGYPLFAVLTLRARILPRYPALLMFGFCLSIVVTMIPGVPEMVSDQLVGLTLYLPFAAFGYALVTGAREAEAPSILPVTTGYTSVEHASV